MFNTTRKKNIYLQRSFLSLQEKKFIFLITIFTYQLISYLWTIIPRGQGTGGVWGGPTSPRIRDLYSKNFENSQNIFSFLLSDPPQVKIVPWPLLIHNAKYIPLLQIIHGIIVHCLPQFSNQIGRGNFLHKLSKKPIKNEDYANWD